MKFLRLLAAIAAIFLTAPAFGGSGPEHPDRATLLLHTDGNFYGTTPDGGVHGHGTIYRVTPAGAVSVLVNFTGMSGPRTGSEPFGGLVSDGAGALWGTTQAGGADDRGTVFKVDVSTGALTTLAEFSGEGAPVAGGRPSTALVSDGNFFWGTTEVGGGSDLGTIFKIHKTTGQLNTVVEFTGDGGLAKGSYPSSELVSDGDGFLWGTTYAGGAQSFGTVFKVETASGALSTVVQFDGTGTAPGGAPYGGLVSDGLGFLWGTTSLGGSSGFGTVFKVNTSTGMLSTPLEFTGNGGTTPGSEPLGTLATDGAGNLWGTTSKGGASGAGTIFKVSVSTGAFSPVQSFTGAAGAVRGLEPIAGLVSDGEGFFWGTTRLGGANGLGSVVKVNQSTGVVTEVASFTPQLTPLEAWKLQYLGDANANDLGDPDRDGVRTTDEYALRLLPTTSDTPPAVSFASYPEGVRLRLLLPRDPTRLDVTIEVLAASDLAGPWTVIARSILGAPFTGTGYVGGDSFAAGVKTVEVRDVSNVGAAPQRFLRLQVKH
jgi:uncharacterized repeat protein (TIGR03803 family)